MVPGIHTWAIASNLTNKETFGSKSMQQFVAALAAKPGRSGAAGNVVSPCQHRKSYATITLFPQVSSHLNSKIAPHAKSEMIWSGTPGLDELILGDAEYWSRADLWSQTSINSKWKCGVAKGGTTLLLGASGTAKTVILTQFLIAVAKPEGHLPRDKKPTRSTDLSWVAFLAKELGKTLYISFEGWSAPNASYREVNQGGGTASNFDKLFYRHCRQLYPAPSNMDPNRLLAELRWLVRNHNIERVAIDGLHEFATTMPPDSRMDAVKSVLYAIKDANQDTGDRTPPTIMASYELTVEGAVAEDAESVSALADNVLMLRQVLVSDQMRKSVTVLKARTQSHDRQVREIVMNPRHKEQTPGCRVIGGFDGLSNVTSGDAKPALVALQLFEENAAERKFNRGVSRLLGRRFPNAVNSYSFSRAELEQLFDESTRMLGGGGFTDIRVLSLDEWWLRDLVRSLGYKPHRPPAGSVSASPLLRLDGFFALREVEVNAPSRLPHHQHRATATVRGLPSEFWITEVEKCTDTIVSLLDSKAQGSTDGYAQTQDHDAVVKPEHRGPCGNVPRQIHTRELDPQMLAIPDYADFGLFCVSEGVMKSLPKDPKHRSFRDGMPRLWATPTTNWFEPPCPGGATIVDFLATHMVDSENKVIRRGFWVDLGKPQTATCFLLELAWSFGVCEEFLTWAASDFFCDGKKKPGDSRQVEALRVALRLVQYLTFHRLLSIDGTKDGSVNAVMSRQWYSTLNIGRDETKPAIDQQVPVPFFPLTASADDGHWIRARHVRSEVLDLRRHVSGLCKRMYWAFRWIERYWEQQLGMSSTDEGARDSADGVSLDSRTREHLMQDLATLQSLIAKIAETRDNITQLRDEMDELNIQSSSFKSDVEKCFAKLKQLAEKLRQHGMTPLGALSARQIRWGRWSFPSPETFGPNGGANSDSGLDEARRWLPAAMAMDGRDVAQIMRCFDIRADLLSEELADSSLDGPAPTALAGFGCSGTWMLGVATGTHSPRVSWKLIEELTSLELTVKRAEIGAGIPTRKDFYELHGETVVPRIPGDISWNEFLSVAGSRVRRRDVAVCRRIPLSQLATQIHLQVMRCYRSAVGERGPVAASVEAASVEAVDRMNAVVEAAIEQIMLFIWNAQRNIKTDDLHRGTPEAGGLCVSCPAVNVPDRSWSCGNVCGTTSNLIPGTVSGVQ